jgi:hypothetical protein
MLLLCLVLALALAWGTALLPVKVIARARRVLHE